MKKTLRALVGVAVLAVFAVGAPAAQATHENPAVPVNGWPGPAGHEKRPVVPVPPPVPESVCKVTGLVNTVEDYNETGNPDHSVAVFPDIEPTADSILPGANSNPSHTHFSFEEVLLTCAGTAVSGDVGVVADGGNDGHIPLLPEDDQTAGGPAAGCATPGTPDGEHDFSNNATLCQEDGHHGAINLSGWSNSSGYTACAVGDTAPHTNKGDITATQGGTAQGWVKYDRIGTVVIAWGQFPCTGAGENGNFTGKHFWAPLAISVEIPPGGTLFAIDGVASVATGLPY